MKGSLELTITRLKSIEDQWHSIEKRVEVLATNYGNVLLRDVEKFYEDVIRELPNFVARCQSTVKIGMFPSNEKIYEYATELADFALDQCGRMAKDWEREILPKRFENELASPLSIIADDMAGLIMKVTNECAEFPVMASRLQTGTNEYGHCRRIDATAKDAFEKFAIEIKLVGMNHLSSSFQPAYYPQGIINIGCILPTVNYLNMILNPMPLKKEIRSGVINTLSKNIWRLHKEQMVEINRLYSEKVFATLMGACKEFDTNLRGYINEVNHCMSQSIDSYADM